MKLLSLIEKLDRLRSGKKKLSRSYQPFPSHSEQPTDRTVTGRSRQAVSIDQLARRAADLKGIRRSDVRRGDWILVQTKNSLYSICSVGDNRFSVSGGWFDRKGISPQEVTIDGCTWGGRAINIDLIAARGLFLGFGNSVVTTRIRDVRLFKDEDVTFRA